MLSLQTLKHVNVIEFLEWVRVLGYILWMEKHFCANCRMNYALPL